MSEEARELLSANRALIERAVAFVCRRYRFNADQAEEFASMVDLKLLENDCAAVRAFQHRSSIGSYLSSIVQHLALDYCNHLWGKWRTSAEAERLGPPAPELEQLLHRDGRSFDEALAILAARHEGLTRGSLEALAQKLPERAPRHYDVSLDEAVPFARAGLESVEERALADERRIAAQRVSDVLSAEIAQLPEDERLVLQLRFEQGITVAQIARMLGRDQKLLYRLIEKRMREMRVALEKEGVLARDVADLIGRDEAAFCFGFGKAAARPSKESDEKVAHAEEPS